MPKAQDVDSGVLPDKAPAGTGDAAFVDARDKYAQAFGEANAWGPSMQASNVTPGLIGRNDMEARRFQDANAARLASIASGGPGGVAVPTAQANLASAQKLNSAYVGSKPGGNVAANLRLAGNTNQAQGAQAAARVGMLGAQEKMAAYGALNPALGNMRAQDFGVNAEQAKLKAQASLANAGFQQNAALQNQQAWQQQQGVKRAAYGAMTGNDKAMWDTRYAELQALAGEADWDRELSLARQQRADMQTASTLDTLGRGASAFGDAASADGAKYDKDPKGYYASDRNVKTNIKPGDAALVDMFEAAFGGE